MAQPHFPANREIEMVLLALQVFQVLFLWVHDWIPLGRLNDVAAVRSQDTRGRLVTVTLIQSVLWTIGLGFSLLYFRARPADIPAKTRAPEARKALLRGTYCTGNRIDFQEETG